MVSSKINGRRPFGEEVQQQTLPCPLEAPYVLLGQVHVNLRTTRTEANTRAGGLGCSPERSRGTNEGGFEMGACTMYVLILPWDVNKYRNKSTYLLK